ncbi:MAG: ABC transporter permease [Burkholderiales bacterium]|nr:ABC transporter permease [Burkholderiales bacterium]
MKIKDILEETYSALSSNKIRSGLTMLGIVIGISSVIAMTAIGNGAQSSITDSIQSIGSNMITIRPGAQRGVGMQVSGGRGTAKSLTLEDSEAIKEKVSSVKNVTAEVSGRYQVTAKGTNTNTTVNGITTNYLEVRNLEIEEGSFITDQNVESGAKVAVVGPTVRDDLFGEGGNAVGQTIRINNMQFKIIGITKSKGGTGFSNLDDIIYIPISTAQRYFSGDQYVSSISVSAESAETTSAVQENITTLLLERHNITDSTLADFSTLNQADIIATASSVTSTFTTLLAAIAGISLLVGGIGIMNMMLTTVTERTREIGLRKAIGAKRKDVSRQFLLEAVMITFLGGVIGVILGWFISLLVTKLGIITTKVSISSVFLAFGVSAIIGILFGYYPAAKAAKLNPIDALRYE